MLIHIEKIFAKENLCFEHPNPEIMYFNAEKRGSQNCKFIMSMINHKKTPKQVTKNELGQFIQPDIDFNKITYHEYITGLRELKDLYKRILP